MTDFKAPGLTQKESLIYDALLRAGRLNLSALARHSGIKKTTLYLHLESMLARDIIRQTVIGRRKFYFAESPEKIFSQLQDGTKQFEKALPGLMEIFRSARSEPNIVLYSGKEGIVKAIVEVLDGALYVKNFWSPRKYYHVFEVRENKFNEIAVRDELKPKVLLEHTSESRHYLKTIAPPVSQFRILPEGFENLPISVIVTGSKVALMSYDDLFCVVIHNRVIAGFVEVMFDNLWKQTK